MLLASVLCSRSVAAEEAPPVPGLKDAASGLFEIGVGINDRIPQRSGDHPLLLRNFSILTPENCMKPASLQPQEGQWHFGPADALVAFAGEHQLKVAGHCLLWAKDDSTPRWFFRNSDGTLASRDQLLARLKLHIETVVGRYRGRVKSWDVINEALADGPGEIRQSQWKSVIGDDFIARAFEFAHQADPDALLIYNDYGCETPPKRDKLLRLVRSLHEQHVPIGAVGLQGHFMLDAVPFDEVERTIGSLHDLGLKVAISELDMDVVPRGDWRGQAEFRSGGPGANPFRDGCPPEVLQRQADQYAHLFQIYRRHASDIVRVTFWNLHDGQSWLNFFPRRRTNYPLLFDREGKEKPAFAAVIQALTEDRHGAPAPSNPLDR